MYPYHRVLARAQDLIEFYVIDARHMMGGKPAVQLTVLLDPAILWPRVMELYFELHASMMQKDLSELAADLGIEVPADHYVLFNVVMKPLVAVQS